MKSDLRQNTQDQPHRTRGFTLIEIMVSLAVFAVVAAALLKGASQTIYQTGLLQERAIASWVADTRIKEVYLAKRTAADFPSQGSERQDAMIAGREWEIETRYLGTENRDVLRVEVDVFLSADEQTPRATLVGFIGRY